MFDRFRRRRLVEYLGSPFGDRDGTIARWYSGDAGVICNPMPDGASPSDATYQAAWERFMEYLRSLYGTWLSEDPPVWQWPERWLDDHAFGLPAGRAKRWREQRLTAAKIVAELRRMPGERRAACEWCGSREWFCRLARDEQECVARRPPLIATARL